MTSREDITPEQYLELADQKLDAARWLFEGGFFTDAASRSYYAAFYAVKALLVAHGLQHKTHSGLIATLHQKFVHTGLLDRHLSENLRWLYEVRQRFDYEQPMIYDAKTAQRSLELSEMLIREIKDHLRRTRQS